MVTEQVKLYRCEVRGVGEESWVHNGLTFATVEEAAQYGSDLSMRWFGMDEYRVATVDGVVIEGTMVSFRR